MLEPDEIKEVLICLEDGRVIEVFLSSFSFDWHALNPKIGRVEIEGVVGFKSGTAKS